jgi:hypothetical protein
MKSDRENELANPVAALDGLPLYRRVPMGCAAMVSGIFAGVIGGATLHVTFATDREVNPWVATIVGPGLLVVGLFMVLVWLRLWFGPREWLDRTINRLFMRSYGYLVLVVVSLMVFGMIKMSRK